LVTCFSAQLQAGDMAQYYTLDEASRKLGISGEEFRRKLATEWKTLRRFPDGNTLRFQAREIDELARTLGRASEAELPTGEEPLSLIDDHAGAPKQEFIPLASDESAIPTSKTPKSGSDSDVKLQAGDSGRHAPDHGSTEELNLASGPKSPPPSKGGSSKKLPPQRPTSEQELSLDAGSDDFDLQLTDDGSDEINIGRGGRAGKRPGDSGINLQDPADSGISLEKDSSEFELQLDADAPVKKPGSSGKIGKPPASKKIQPVTPPPSMQDSDSEFELTLDEGSDAEATPFDSGEQKDIFETDFEIPAVDDSSSGSQTDSALDDSDFEISDDSGDESASEVVAIEEEDLEDELRPIDDDEPVVTAESLAPPKPATWGLIPVVGGSITLLFMFFVSIMSYELLHSMWGYHAPVKVAGGFVRTVAEQFGELPKD
jgi:hypothetical protein